MDIINEVTNLDISDYFTYRRNRFSAPEQTQQQDEMLEESGL